MATTTTLPPTTSAALPAPPATFDFQSEYVKIDGHRIHYVETGQGDPILFVHGNPTSSYVWRNVLQPIADATGRRCIALDLLGFGKSDKPNVQHTAQLHATLLERFIQRLQLQNIVLVAEDWGGFFGGHLMVQHPQWFRAAVLMETFLWPMTYKDDFDKAFVMPFKLMRSPIGGLFSKRMNMMINKMIPEHCPISDESLQYYKDSVPTVRLRKAIGDFPKMLPVNGHPKASHDFGAHIMAHLDRIDFPVLWILADPGVVVSRGNPIGMGRLEAVQAKLPQMETRHFGPGYHFLSEERPDKVASMVSEWLRENALTV